MAYFENKDVEERALAILLKFDELMYTLRSVNKSKKISKPTEEVKVRIVL
jgi:hypothetical protein